MANYAQYSQRKTFTRLTPDMTPEQQARVLNENFALLNGIFSSWVVYDDDNPRIIIGRQPDGDYGIVVSKTGEDVLEAFE